MYIPTNILMENGVRQTVAFRYNDKERRLHTVTVGDLVDRVRELEQQIEQAALAVGAVKSELEEAA